MIRQIRSFISDRTLHDHKDKPKTSDTRTHGRVTPRSRNSRDTLKFVVSSDLISVLTFIPMRINVVDDDLVGLPRQKN